MTVREAAREIGLSADAVYDLCKKGMLRHRRVGPNGGRIQILPHHVAAYLESCEVTTENSPAAAAPRPTRKAPVREARLDGKPFRHTR